MRYFWTLMLLSQTTFAFDFDNYPNFKEWFYKAGANTNDQVRNLVWEPEKLVTNFNSINKMGLYRRTTKMDPWSGHYFPVYRGVIASRYGDKGFNDNNETWFRSYRYVKQNSAETIYNSKDLERINQLSAAEKYDLIMNSDYSLTNKMWELGRKFFERDGKVETWMGICHGWSPASYSMDRPINAVTIPSARQGVPITFYPADIKALAAALHAYTPVTVNFAGQRCDEQIPATDHNGRPTEDACRDTNPATFHLALANQIGITGSPVIMDSSFDFEVWNSPITAYHFLYINPITKKVPRSMAAAVVEARDYRWSSPGDPFGRFRSPNAKYIVQVRATVTAASETWATQSTTDSPSMDRNNRTVYEYDLELDDNYNIIGGEWISKSHPDFLWTTKRSTDVVTEGDIRLLDHPMWEMNSQVPAEYTNEAKIVSEKTGSPLALVVQKLIELSRR